MAAATRRVSLNYRILTVLLVVALPILALGGFIVSGIGQAHLRDTYSENLEGIAERLAAAVDTFFFSRIIDVSVLARVSDVREVAAAGSAAAFDPDTARQIDAEWQEEQAPPAAVADVLENTASLFLRDAAGVNPVYRELLMTDRNGRLVAASNVTSDYMQDDEPWWQNTFRGRRVSIGDVQWDESARTYAIEISAPVVEPGSDRVTGVLKAVLDAREMLTAVAGHQFGATGEAAIVRTDGSVVYSRSGVQPGTQFFATALVRESLGLVGGPEPDPSIPPTNRAADPQFRASFSARTDEGELDLVAIAPTQLGASYPELPWLVAVSQSEDELFASARAQVWYFLGLLAMVALAVLVFALWFSVRLAAPPVDVIDMHLVEHGKAAPRIDEERTAE